MQIQNGLDLANLREYPIHYACCRLGLIRPYFRYSTHFILPYFRYSTHFCYTSLLQVQYTFLFDMMKRFLDSFTIYSNFK